MFTLCLLLFPFFFTSLTVQTVEAMKTILDSLSVDDYFSIIDFNHNVRCWSEELVSGNSIKVAEAKQYIQDIKPNGGERERERKSLSLSEYY